VRKAHNLMWVCRRACGVRWGLGPKVVYWLYVAIVCLAISFASLVWLPGCQTASAKRQLSWIQRLACFGITRAICMTPTAAMEAPVGLPPLDVMIQGEPRLMSHRLWSLGCWSYLQPPARTQLHTDLASEV
jgi:hypothetical protein